MPSPAALRAALPVPDDIARLVGATRAEAAAILAGHRAPRLLVVLGPCSLHDPVAALEYAEQVRGWQTRFGGMLLLVMRAYLEKPRTRLGWKGLINDPRLDGSFRIGEGLHAARRLLLGINALGVPTATEFLDTTSAAFLEDLVSWSAIGARTSESPLHRQLASGLPCPVGFKNGTGGSLEPALNGILAARSRHHLIAPADDGALAVVATDGNPAAHLILRGGTAPNHDAETVAAAEALLVQHGLAGRLMIDCGHGNSRGDFRRQLVAARDAAAQIDAGGRAVAGVMLESNLIEGQQAFVPGTPLRYGQSITDPCLGLAATEDALTALDGAMRRR